MSDTPTPSYRVAPDDVRSTFSRKMREMERAQNEKLARQHARDLGLPYINLEGFPIEPEALRFIPTADAQRLKIIPFNKTETVLRIGAVNPEDPRLRDERLKIEQRERIQTELYVMTEYSLEVALPLYSMVPEIHAVEDTVTITPESLARYSSQIHSPEDLEHQLKNIPLTDMVTFILAGGVVSGASDIHIEAEENDIKIRYRIDGILNDAATIDRHLWRRLITRIKEIARLKINVDKVPQDGHIRITAPDERIEIRVSTLPTNWGESVVMRLLLERTRRLRYDDLGIRGRAYDALKKEIQRPNGMIIVTGPTGSGKTTTLYAILNELNTPQRNIITLENPIEYQVPGLNQTQIDLTKQFTFATALRSVLRQDPDIIMVGEIRDADTADVGIQAALTGHLVLSTVHTNDAAGAIPRLLSLDAKSYLLAPALNAVIGQRLVRRIHPDAETTPEDDPDLLERAHHVLATLPEHSEEKERVSREEPKFRKPASSKTTTGKKGGQGYKGRVGIFEILVINEALEGVLKDERISEVEIRKAAREHGMISMVQDGVLKAFEGITSLEEVFRVTEDIE